MIQEKRNATGFYAGSASANSLWTAGFTEANFPTAAMRRQPRSAASPITWLPLFNRVWQARNLAQMHAALNALVPRLLKRGQDPQAVAADLVQLAQQASPGLHLVVAPTVNDLALARRRAA